MELNSINHITPLIFKDKVLFESAIRKEPFSAYSDSWLYTLRFARNDFGKLGYKFYSSDLLFTIVVRNHDVIVGRIFGELSPRNLDLIVSMVLDIRKVIQTPILFKKVSEYNREILQKSLKLSDKNNSGEFMEDETYPEKLIILQEIINTSNLAPIPKRFRLGVNRFINKNIKITERVLNGNESLDSRITNLQYLCRGNRAKYYSYLPMIIETKNNPGKYIVIAYYSEQSIEGLYVAEKLKKKDIGLYCAITSAKWGGITEYLDYLFFKYLLNAEFEKLYLGGSETQGVVYYVNKLNPHSPEYNRVPLILY